MTIKSWLGRTFGLTDPAPWSAFWGVESYSGKAVTPESALSLATVWACVRLTAQAVSVLPLQIFEKDSAGSRKPLPDHPLAEILTESPNDSQTSQEYWEAVVAWLCVQGNAYSEIVRSGDRVIALNLLPADQVQVVRNEANEIRYKFTDRGRPFDLPAESVLHFKGLSFGGDVGLSPVRFGAQTFGTSIAADETAGRFLGAGMMPSGALTTEKETVLTTEQRAQLTGIMQKYAGSRNSGKMMVLEGGIKFEQISLDPESVQLIETRRFHIEEICRWFGVPPIIVGHAAQGQTMWGTGVEALLIQWLTTGLNPYLTRIERRLKKQMLAPGERRRTYFEFNREALLQADSAAKAAFLSSMVQNGLLSRNEGRAKLNLPRVEGGDALTAQTNLAPLDQLGASDPVSGIRRALGIEESE